MSIFQIMPERGLNIPQKNSSVDYSLQAIVALSKTQKMPHYIMYKVVDNTTL